MSPLLAILLGSAAMFALGFFVWQCMSARSFDDAFSWLSGFVMVIGLVAMLVFGIMWGSTYYSSYNRIQSLAAFQNETMSAYEYTIDRTESVVIDTSQTRGGSFTDFSYQQQGMAVSERIKEFRDMVHGYNREVYKLRGNNRLPVIGAMYYNVPDDLKPIKIGSVSVPNP